MDVLFLSSQNTLMAYDILSQKIYTDFNVVIGDRYYNYFKELAGWCRDTVTQDTSFVGGTQRDQLLLLNKFLIETGYRDITNHIQKERLPTPERVLTDIHITDTTEERSNIETRLLAKPVEKTIVYYPTGEKQLSDILQDYGYITKVSVHNVFPNVFSASIKVKDTIIQVPDGVYTIDTLIETLNNLQTVYKINHNPDHTVTIVGIPDTNGDRPSIDIVLPSPIYGYLGFNTDTLQNTQHFIKSKNQVSIHNILIYYLQLDDNTEVDIHTELYRYDEKIIQTVEPIKVVPSTTFTLKTENGDTLPIPKSLALEIVYVVNEK
jgi:hypothetical protein